MCHIIYTENVCGFKIELHGKAFFPLVISCHANEYHFMAHSKLFFFFFFTSNETETRRFNFKKTWKIEIIRSI